MSDFFRSLLMVTGEMSPYLLLGFLIAGYTFKGKKQ